MSDPGPDNLILRMLSAMDAKLDQIIAGLHDLKVRTTSVEEVLIPHLATKADLAALETSFSDKLHTAISASATGLRSEFAGLRAEIAELRTGQRTDFRWMLAGFAALLGVMAHGFKWL